MHDATQNQNQEPASSAAPTSAPMAEANGTVKTAKRPSVSTDTSFFPQVAASGVVESPQAVHQSQSSASLADYAAHLSGHEARAFPGIFTRGTRSSSTRKDDGASSTHEAAEGNSS